jgi:hypothetical protein
MNHPRHPHRRSTGSKGLLEWIFTIYPSIRPSIDPSIHLFNPHCMLRTSANHLRRLHRQSAGSKVSPKVRESSPSIDRSVHHPMIDRSIFRLHRMFDTNTSIGNPPSSASMQTMAQKEEDLAE